MMEPLAPNIRVPEDLLEVRNRLASRAENWKQTWLQEGRQEEELRGTLKGKCALLIRQMERKYGALPGSARDRIASASAAELEEWSLRVLDSESLQDVLR